MTFFVEKPSVRTCLFFSHRPWKASIQTRALLLFVGLWYGNSGWCHKKAARLPTGPCNKADAKAKKGDLKMDFLLPR